MLDVDISESLRQRHRRVRAGFMLQGSSLPAWCKAQGIARQNVDQALFGQ